MKKTTRVLWVVNVPLPEGSKLLNLPYQPYGGWLIELSKQISKNNNIDLHIAFPNYHKEGKAFSQETHITYHAVKNKRINLEKSYSESWKKLLIEINPDLVNIFGTEYSHAYIVSNICKNMGKKNLVTIQGVPTFISKHVRAQLPSKIYYGMSLRNFILQDSVYLSSKKFKAKGHKEKSIVTQSDGVIGRTQWDRACMELIDPNVEYYHCEETLRKSFESGRWKLENVQRYSIFFSQGEYSIKGLHLLLEMMPTIIKKYPETKLYIAGPNVTDFKSFKKNLMKKKYYSYIKSLINRGNLDDHITFTGPLNEEEMKERYLKSHLFICASTIENSPNSVAEALKIGVPTIASYVGGIPDIISDGYNGILYQSDAPYLLPSKIFKIFSSDSFASEISENAYDRAKKGKSLREISCKMIGIYKNVLKDL